MSLFRYSDYRKKKENPKKTKLPSKTKSKPVYCRNCNRQNSVTAKICIQCECEIKEPKLRRKMR